MIKWTPWRRSALARIATHGCLTENEVAGRGVINPLIAAGLVWRCSGRKGNPSTVQITEAGRVEAARQAEPCPCYRCAKQRLADAERVNADTTIASSETRDDES